MNQPVSLFGIIGDPISHTKSPLMHHAGFKKIGYNGVYIPFHIIPSELEKGIGALKTLSIKGFNVTIPHKETIIPFLDEVDPLAKRIGAVNTVINQHGRLKGFNTDGVGFTMSVKHELGVSFSNKKIIIITTSIAPKAPPGN